MRKKITFLSSIVLLLLFASNISAQVKYEIPADVQLNVKEDYAKYENDIIAATNWLETNSLDSEPEKRKLVSAFVMKWIMGSPSVQNNYKNFMAKMRLCLLYTWVATQGIFWRIKLQQQYFPAQKQVLFQ